MNRANGHGLLHNLHEPCSNQTQPEPDNQDVGMVALVERAWVTPKRLGGGDAAFLGVEQGEREGEPLGAHGTRLARGWPI